MHLIGRSEHGIFEISLFRASDHFVAAFSEIPGAYSVKLFKNFGESKLVLIADSAGNHIDRQCSCSQEAPRAFHAQIQNEGLGRTPDRFFEAAAQITPAHTQLRCDIVDSQILVKILGYILHGQPDKIRLFGISGCSVCILIVLFDQYGHNLQDK